MTGAGCGDETVVVRADAETTCRKASDSYDTVTTRLRFPGQTTNIHYAGDKQFKFSSSK